MSVTFTGTFTQGNGATPARGSVGITPDGEGTTTVTISETGTISHTESDGTGPNFTIVTTSTGGPTITQTVRALDGETVDLSFDAGNLAKAGLMLGALMATADPHVVGELWSNSGVVTVSAG